MELALKPAECPLANVLQDIQDEFAPVDTFYNDHSRTDIGPDYSLANPAYANFPGMRRCS